jgi:hypothetical protein
MANGKDIHPRALRAASAALDRELQAVAAQQGGYVHRFPDGKLSLELEWVCTVGLARAAIRAYLGELEDADEN